MRSLSTLLHTLILASTILPSLARQHINRDGLLSRINYGVIFRERQPIRIVTDEWTHVFITELPKQHNTIEPSPVSQHQLNCTELSGLSATSCASVQPLIDTLSSLHKNFITRIRSTINHIYTILPASYNRRQHRGLFDLGGQVLSSLFGVATQQQLQAIRSTAQKTMTDNANAFHQWQKHTDEMNSFMSLANQRFDNIAQVMRNHETLIQHAQKATSQLTTEFHIFQALVTSAINNITSFMNVFHQLDDMRIAIEDLTHGQLSPILLPPDILTQTLHHLHSYLFQNRHSLTSSILLGKVVADYYKSHQFTCARQGSKLLIAINVSLSPIPSDLTLYEIQSFPVRVPGRHNTAYVTEIVNLPYGVAFQSTQKLD